MRKTKRKKKAAPKRRRRLTARNRDIIHDLAVAQGIAFCREWEMGPRYWPKAIAIVEAALIERFKQGRL